MYLLRLCHNLIQASQMRHQNVVPASQTFTTFLCVMNFDVSRLNSSRGVKIVKVTIMVSLSHWQVSQT